MRLTIRQLLIVIAAASVTALPSPAGAEAQPSESAQLAKNTAYFEVGGPGFLYSLNPERQFGDVAVRGGIHYSTIRSCARQPELLPPRR
jgi:hypothetical protein